MQADVYSQKIESTKYVLDLLHLCFYLMRRRHYSISDCGAPLGTFAFFLPSLYFQQELTETLETAVNT